MKSILITLILVLTATLQTHAKTKEEPIKLDVGRNYDSYSKEDLRRRVWQLERAVEQLQNQVFQLAINNNSSGSTLAAGGNWTCQIEAFGKIHVAGGNTRASALAQAMKKCSDDSNAIHCPESKAKCSND